MSGSIAGTVDRRGRVHVKIGDSAYRAHRIAWLHFYGEWPSDQIDHINGNPSDNRIANLRDVDGSTNRENQRKARTDNLSSGTLGVTWCKHYKKWKASIRVKGVLKHIKYCDSLEAAEAAYLAAKRAMHIGCTI